MKLVFAVIALLFAGWFIYNSFLKYPVRYIGYFYPDKSNMEKWIESPPLSSVDACRDWVNTQIKDENQNYDYECGKDCYKGDPYNQGLTHTCNSSLR